jgi:hypothetical protein
MKKLKKWAIGIAVLLGLGLVAPDTQEEENIEVVNAENMEQGTTENEVEETTKQPSLTSEELITKLEFYEYLYSSYLESIDKSAAGNDPLEMQNSFAEVRDTSMAVFELLRDIKKEYEGDSSEYSAIYELQTAFNSLNNACKNGIKYIDKNEYKYFEKYKNNLTQSAIFIERYNDAKAEIVVE